MWNRYRYNYAVQAAIATIIAAGLFMIVLAAIITAKTRPSHHRALLGRCRPTAEGIVAAHYFHDRVYWTVKWAHAEFRSGNTSRTCYNLTTEWLTATREFNASSIAVQPCWAQHRNCTATLYNPNSYQTPDASGHRRSWYSLYALSVPAGSAAFVAGAYILWDEYRRRLVMARQSEYQNLSSSDLYMS